MSKLTPKLPELTENDRIKALQALKKSADNTKFLSKTAKSLINAFDLVKLVWQLKDGKSLVINENGDIFTGKINTEKLTKLPDRIAGKSDNSIDGQARQEFIRTKWSVSSPGRTFKNAWDNQVIKSPKESDDIMAAIFLMACEEFNPPISQLEWLNSEEQIKYFIIEIKSIGMKGFFSHKTGHLKYLEIDGKEYRIK